MEKKKREPWSCKSSFPCADCLNQCDEFKARMAGLQVLADRAAAIFGTKATATLKKGRKVLMRAKGRKTDGRS